MGKVVRMRSKRNYSKKGKGKAKPTRKPKTPKRRKSSRKSTKRKSRKKRKSTKKKMKSGVYLKEQIEKEINKYIENMLNGLVTDSSALHNCKVDMKNYLPQIQAPINNLYGLINRRIEKVIQNNDKGRMIRLP